MTEILEDINAQLAGYARELASANQKDDAETAAAVQVEIDRLSAYVPPVETTVDTDPAEEVAVNPEPEVAVAPAPFETTQA